MFAGSYIMNNEYSNSKFHWLFFFLNISLITTYIHTTRYALVVNWRDAENIFVSLRLFILGLISVITYVVFVILCTRQELHTLFYVGLTDGRGGPTVVQNNYLEYVYLNVIQKYLIWVFEYYLYLSRWIFLWRKKLFHILIVKRKCCKYRF